MRVALCLSGQPRFFQKGFAFWRDSVIAVNDRVDVFLHCWFDPCDAGKEFAGAPWTAGRAGVVRPDTLESLERLYQPKKFQHEPQRRFPLPRDYSGRQAKTPPELLFSQSYSVNRANALKREYERENGFAYDWVIRGRYDCALLDKLRLSDFTSDVIHFPDDVPLPRTNDLLAFSSSANMDYYCDFHAHMDECWCSSSALMAGEDLLGFYLYRRGGHGLKPEPIDYRVIRTCPERPNETAC